MEIEKQKIPHQLNKRQILELAKLIYPVIESFQEYFSIDKVLFNLNGVESNLTGAGLCQQGKVMVNERFTFDMKTLNKDYVKMTLVDDWYSEEDDEIPDEMWIDDPKTLEAMEEVIEIYDQFVLTLKDKGKKPLWK